MYVFGLLDIIIFDKVRFECEGYEFDGCIVLCLLKIEIICEIVMDPSSICGYYR